MKHTLHPAWFNFEPGEQPSLNNIVDSLNFFADELSATGSLLIDVAESPNINEDCIGPIGYSLVCRSRELKVLADLFPKEAPRADVTLTEEQQEQELLMEAQE